MISVLMSVYNETLDEIRQSVDSVLSQSFSDFELIVVVDQPAYAEGLALLEAYARKDNRVSVLINEKNIGLAMSMNRAAEHARGEWLLRMDADDICLPGRFRLQYDAVCTGKYDLICGNYDFIDEDGNLLPQKAMVCTDRQLDLLLPLRNAIHHPTVIMSAELFHKVGGYRDYPCAQDYDLWLRMKCAGARMHMLPEKLICYRVRQAATTVQKRYRQACTGQYIRMLYRQNKPMEEYSYEGYLVFLKRKHVNDPVANEDYIRNFNCYMGAKQALKKGRLIVGIQDMFHVVFQSKYYRPEFVNSLKIAAIMKFVR